MLKRFLAPAGLLLMLAVPAAAYAVDQVVDPQHPAEAHPNAPDRAALECRDCHACDHPIPADPCLAACPRHSDHFYGEHQADEGPDIVIIDQLANLYRPVVFSHKLHAQMSNMAGGCENCHHYSERGGAIPPCRQCHDPASNEVSLGQPALKGAYHRQCINCHLDWSHENACGFCHAQADGQPVTAQRDTTDIVGVPHPLIAATPTYTYQTSYAEGPLVTFHHVDHVEMFGQQCVDCHRGDTCRRCHDTGGKQVAKLNHVTTCCSCHMERNCDFCHSDKTQPRFEHAAATGWDLAPYHTGKECKVCHGSPQTFRTPSHTCTDCHIHWKVGSFNHAVTGVQLDETHVELDCENCHIGMDMSVAPRCTECHDEAMFPGKLPGKRVSRR